MMYQNLPSHIQDPPPSFKLNHLIPKSNFLLDT